MTLLLSVLLTFTLSASAPGDEVPQARQGVFAITNARIVTVTNGTIERGTLVIRGGTIDALGPDVTVPDDAEVIDADGLTVYPGFIDSGTQLGLAEIGSLRETRDFDEIGDVTPHVEALTAVNPSSVHVPVARVNGVLTVLTEPSGNLLPGAAALIALHGYTPQQMQVGDVRPVLVEWPSTARRGSWDDREQEKIVEQAQEKIDKLNEVWDQAEVYARVDSAYRANPGGRERPDYQPALEALVPVLRGERPVLIKVDKAEDIQKALAWVEKRGLENVLLGEVAEGWRVADEIAAAGIPALVGPVLSVPTRDSDRYDKAYSNAGLMREAGVTVALRTGESENVRNLPFHAGFAAAYGMGREAALEAVTIAPARIFGVDDQLGSLEPGKRATLFLADGDPFEAQTQIEQVFIDGYLIPMESRQTRLYEEFLDREPGLEKE